MRFLVDEQLPPSLAAAIARFGHEAVHVRDAPGRGCSDKTIAAFAVEGDWVVVTKDSDFAAMRGLSVGLRVVWLRMGNVCAERLSDRLAATWPSVSALLDAGERIVELR